MALAKQNIPIPFAKGLDQKIDPLQLPPSNFAALKNTVFTKGGRLGKRNGFPYITSLPSSSYSYLTSFRDTLTAVGANLAFYSPETETWTQKGSIIPLSLKAVPTVRSGYSQTQVDSVLAPNGLVCTVFTENSTYKYSISNSVTGQNIIAPTLIVPSSGTVTYSPRVFLFGKYFLIVFNTVITAVNHIQYIAISCVNNSTVIAATDLSANHTAYSTGSFDGFVANDIFYFAWNGSDGGGAIRISSLSTTISSGIFVQSTTKVIATYSANFISVTADLTAPTPIIYIAFHKTAGALGYLMVVDHLTNTLLSPTLIINGPVLLNISCGVQNGTAQIFYEVTNNYSYDSSIPTHYVSVVSCTLAGSVGSTTVVMRSVGLASKVFIYNSQYYFLGTYSSSFQPTYFLINGTLSTIAGKLAYSNGGGYVVTTLASVTVTDNVINFSYLYKDLIQPVNKAQGATSPAGVYVQTGINLATITFGTDEISTVEVAGVLHLSGGFLWMHDGLFPVEHGFFLWPDNLKTSASAAGGNITTQNYYYVAVYEWTDYAGNVHRSAPSIPVAVASGSLSGSSNTITVNVPYLRLTYKSANPVRIVLYRWSTAQQNYYQVSSVSSPTINSLTSDSIAIADTLADSSIIGNTLLYTTGGVVENIAAPAARSMTMYKSRVALLDAEIENLAWYSKQVIQSTPVEFSDLFTTYLTPATAEQNNTGPATAVFGMDDKLIVFREQSIVYVTGNGPDNTGYNNDFSDPTFITSTVGCTNTKSIVLTPIGLMFQSDKGIWLLGRNLSTVYKGAPVEDFNGNTVLSAMTIPGTNQVRFVLDNNVTLMYDYYYDQWGTFYGLRAISAVVSNGQMAAIDSDGNVYQETPGSYIDGSSPTLLSFTTAWLNFAGLQGFVRAYEFYLLGKYISPCKLAISIAYDYEDSPSQTLTITPDNFSGVYGSDAYYGGNNYGGMSDILQWDVNLIRQKCQAFQITIQEIYDASKGVAPGAGFTLSGLNITVGVLDTKPRLIPSRTTS